MVVVAHPDDIETVAGGTVAFMVGGNISVVYIITTNGDKGWSKNYSMTSPKLAQIR
jgi:LmbE family N-acetylglucosaminyl deacetylase